MKLNPLLLTASLTILSLLSASHVAQAEILKIGKHAKVITKADAPRRGLSMKAVQAKFGKAKKISVSKGRVTKRNPRITRWNYGSFSVFFENDHVVHTVVHR
ncbi:MAG: hypothetical protein CSB47_05410 [Proteobacteria bacterium]|nr:MAG: hypothetical protein CSB47_05410 [Pseudomonadota bacterium]